MRGRRLRHFVRPVQPPSPASDLLSRSPPPPAVCRLQRDPGTVWTPRLTAPTGGPVGNGAGRSGGRRGFGGLWRRARPPGTAVDPSLPPRCPKDPNNAGQRRVHGLSTVCQKEISGRGKMTSRLTNRRAGRGAARGAAAVARAAAGAMVPDVRPPAPARPVAPRRAPSRPVAPPPGAEAPTPSRDPPGSTTSEASAPTAGRGPRPSPAGPSWCRRSGRSGAGRTRPACPPGRPRRAAETAPPVAGRSRHSPNATGRGPDRARPLCCCSGRRRPHSSLTPLSRHPSRRWPSATR